MKRLVFLILAIIPLMTHADRDFVRKHDSRQSFLLAHETLNSRLEMNRFRYVLAKDGSVKKRRILCLQIPANLKDLYEINVLNREWQNKTEIEKSVIHLKILERKRNEILMSNMCQGS